MFNNIESSSRESHPKNSLEKYLDIKNELYDELVDEGKFKEATDNFSWLLKKKVVRREVNNELDRRGNPLAEKMRDFRRSSDIDWVILPHQNWQMGKLGRLDRYKTKALNRYKDYGLEENLNDDEKEILDNIPEHEMYTGIRAILDKYRVVLSLHIWLIDLLVKV